MEQGDGRELVVRISDGRIIGLSVAELIELRDLAIAEVGDTEDLVAVSNAAIAWRRSGDPAGAAVLGAAVDVLLSHRLTWE